MDTENNLNIDNLTGNELNQKLEQLLTTPEDTETIRQKKEKAYQTYLKQLVWNRNYRRDNKEKIRAHMAELYRTNPEYKEKSKEKHRAQYYMRRYGMSKEEYLKVKAEKNKEFIAHFTNCTEDKTRFLSFEQFVNKYDIPKIVICN